MTEAERIAPVGYINEDMQHALISIYNPALLNPGPGSVQVATSLESAVLLQAELNMFLLQAELNAFLAAHGHRER